MLITKSPETVVRILFDTKSPTIKEIELLRVVDETSNTLHLSNGKTICKGSLFPYHKKNYNKEQEYFYLDKIILWYLERSYSIQ